jgi:hypothetical protein
MKKEKSACARSRHETLSAYREREAGGRAIGRQSSPKPHTTYLRRPCASASAVYQRWPLPLVAMFLLLFCLLRPLASLLQHSAFV